MKLFPKKKLYYKVELSEFISSGTRENGEKILNMGMIKILDL